MNAEYKVLIELFNQKMPNSKKYDQYWVSGICKAKIKKLIYAEMLVKRFQSMEVQNPDGGFKFLSDIEKAFTALFEEIIDRQQNP